MNISMFSDWVEEQRFGEGSLAPLMAEIIDDAMATDTPGRFGPSESVDRGLLRSAWETAQGEDPLVRTRVAVVLGRLGFSETRETLEQAKHCGDAGLARAAAVVLARLRGVDDDLLEDLLKIVEDPTESREMRAAAAAAIARADKPATTATLVRIARSEDPELARYGVEALGGVHPADGSDEHTAVREILAMAIASDEPDLRRAAIEAAGNFGDPALVPELEKLLLEKDPSVRRRALFALARLGAESARAPLARMVRDFSIPARWEIVDLLAECYGESILDALEAAAEDNDAEIRDHVVSALARMDGPDSLRLLRKIASGDPDGFVREQAMAALARRGAELTAGEPEPDQEPAAAPPPPPSPPPAAVPPPPPGRVARLRPLRPAPPGPEEAAEVVERALEAMYCKWSLDADGYHVDVPLAGRTERVTILLGECDYEQSPLFRFVVRCGPADPGAFEAALRNNRDLEYGALAVVDEAGRPEFVLTDTMPVASATVAGVRKVLASLATAASHLRG